MPRYWVSGPTTRSSKDKGEETKVNGLTDIAHFSMAYAELYLTISRIVRSFTMDLYGTGLEDVKVYHSRAIADPRTVKGQGEGQGKVQVKVTGKTD